MRSSRKLVLRREQIRHIEPEQAAPAVGGQQIYTTTGDEACSGPWLREGHRLVLRRQGRGVKTWLEMSSAERAEAAAKGHAVPLFPLAAPMSPSAPSATAELPRAWWHGCWLEAGHFLFDVRGCRVPCPRFGAPWWLDAGLAPRILRRPAWLPPTFTIPDDRIVFARMANDDARDLRHRLELASEECPQGEFLLHSIAGCTIAAWWDRAQGDTRPGCNSCLIVENPAGREWCAVEMVQLFSRLFPRQAERLERSGVRLRFLRWAP